MRVDGGRVFRSWVLALECDGLYLVTWKVLNVMDSGVPQSRWRLYVVGQRRDVVTCCFAWPPDIPCLQLAEILGDDIDVSDRRQPSRGGANAVLRVQTERLRLVQSGASCANVDRLLDTDTSLAYGGQARAFAPCILHSRRHGQWNMRWGRELTLEQTARLFARSTSDWTPPAPATRAFSALGNSIALCVTDRILCRLLPSVGL